MDLGCSIYGGLEAFVYRLLGWIGEIVECGGEFVGEAVLGPSEGGHCVGVPRWVHLRSKGGICFKEKEIKGYSDIYV